MQEYKETLPEVDLSTLSSGSTIEVQTKSRHYRIEYLNGDHVRISGHPQLCPYPVSARLCGSRKGFDEFSKGHIVRGMQMVFERAGDSVPVTTSEIMEVRVTHDTRSRTSSRG